MVDQGDNVFPNPRQKKHRPGGTPHTLTKKTTPCWMARSNVSRTPRVKTCIHPHEQNPVHHVPRLLSQDYLNNSHLHDEWSEPPEGHPSPRQPAPLTTTPPRLFAVRNCKIFPRAPCSTVSMPNQNIIHLDDGDDTKKNPGQQAGHE